MKHLALALGLAVAARPALAQTTPAPGPVVAGQYQYCNLIGYGTQGRNASLEYGQHPKPLTANPEMEALNEKVKSLESVLLALNYLTSHGWEHVAVSPLSPDATGYFYAGACSRPGPGFSIPPFGPQADKQRVSYQPLFFSGTRGAGSGTQPPSWHRVSKLDHF